MSQHTGNEESPRRSRRVYWMLLAITVGLAAAIAGAATAGFGRHGGGWHHGNHGDPEVMRERMTFALEFGLRKLDATDEQQTAIQAIADRTFESMSTRLGDRERVHVAVRSLLESDEIDRAALEELRQSQVAAFDEASQELVTAAADALDVLTVEQRQQLVAHFDARHARRR